MHATLDSSVPRTTRIASWLLAALCGLALLPVDAQTVVRGPYLQMGTAATQVVRWRTDVATDSRVRFGTSLAGLDAVADVAGLTTEHVVTLTGLAPSTVYYYAIGTTAATLAGGDANQFFITAPPPGTADLARVWVLGDAGTAGPTGSDARQTAVRDAYAKWSQQQYTDLILLLGDNAYDHGRDAEYQSAVFDMYRTFLRRTNLWPTIGNHDTDQQTNPSLATTPYFNIFTLPTAGEAGGLRSGTPKYYAFNFANIHFVCLDSMTSDRSVNGAMLTWLANDLAANTQPWIIAFWHHPPYTKGSHDSDIETALVEMRTNALPILEAYGADLVLGGHSHAYERSKLVAGHYGLSTTLTAAMIKDGGSGRPGETGAYTKTGSAQGTIYAVAGSAGQTTGGPLDHPVMYLSLNELGSLVLDVNGTRLDATFLRDTGEVADSFTIVKQPAVTPPAVTITAPASGARFTAPADIAIGVRATAGNGAIRKVDFYGGATLLGSSTTPPYTFPWRGVPVGAYTITAKITTDAGMVTTSAAVSVNVLPAAPAAPSALVAKIAARTRIDLAWQDNANNETGFVVERSTDGRRFATIAHVGANVTTYADASLAPGGMSYTYRVHAFNDGGASGYSNAAIARTPRR